MNYLTQYYKNLSEQLQSKVNELQSLLNESGLKRALKSGDPALLRKELIKANLKSSALEDELRATWDKEKNDRVRAIGGNEDELRRRLKQIPGALEGDVAGTVMPDIYNSIIIAKSGRKVRAREAAKEEAAKLARRKAISGEEQL